MLEYFDVGISLLISVLGIIVAFLAGRIRPNPFLGFRVGQAMVSEAVWRKVNRVSGYLFALVGAVSAVISLLLQAPLSLMILALLVILATFSLMIYSERVAEIELLREPAEAEVYGEPRRIESVTPPSILVLVGVLVMGLTLLYMALSYHALPQMLAVHFGPTGLPDRFESKETFYLGFTLALLVIYGLTAGFFLAGSRMPMLFHRPWLDWPSMRRIANAVYIVLTIVTTLVSYAVVDIIWYNLHGYHPANPLMTVILGVAIIIAATIYAITITFRAYSEWRNAESR